MLDILLIVVIGGMGTIYGAVIGSVLFVLAQNYLQDLLKLGAGALDGLPLLSPLVSPDRWLLWLGVLFVLVGLLLPDRHRRPASCRREGHPIHPEEMTMNTKRSVSKMHLRVPD